MKHLSREWQEALSNGVTTLATCWRITRADGLVLCFTDHSDLISVEGESYKPDSGSTSGNIEISDSMANYPFSCEGFVRDDAITKYDLRAGKYDNAKVEVFKVDHAQPGMGKIPLKRGFISSVTIRDDVFIAEIAGNNLDATIGTCYSFKCRARLGDELCGVNTEGITFVGVVEQVVSGNTFIYSGLFQETGYFNYGIVRFISGNNTGDIFDVMRYTDGGRVELFTEPFGAMAAGDRFNITAGCDKLLNTCDLKFNNTVNFRGEPHIKSAVGIYGNKKK